MGNLWIGAGLAAVASLIVANAIAATSPGSEVSWAFPTRKAPIATPPSTIHTVPGSHRRFTETQIHDLFHAVDWRPEGKPIPPTIVGAGRAPEVMACGFCHLPRGQGRPENAALAGLPADYIVRQVAAMRVSLRTGARPEWAPTALMHQVAVGATPAEVKVAAAWFASQTFAGHTRVVEALTAPGSRPATGVYRFDPAAPRLRLTARIIEGPDDFERFELRDDAVRYTAYVPEGAISRGSRLAAGGLRAEACSDCHGIGLHGGLGPPLAGRSPTGLFRQLYAFKIGARREANASTMVQELSKLGTNDLVDLAAYTGSLRS